MTKENPNGARDWNPGEGVEVRHVVSVHFGGHKMLGVQGLDSVEPNSIHSQCALFPARGSK